MQQFTELLRFPFESGIKKIIKAVRSEREWTAFLVPLTGLEPVRNHFRWILSY